MEFVNAYMQALIYDKQPSFNETYKHLEPKLPYVEPNLKEKLYRIINEPPYSKDFITDNPDNIKELLRQLEPPLEHRCRFKKFNLPLKRYYMLMDRLINDQIDIMDVPIVNNKDPVFLEEYYPILSGLITPIEQLEYFGMTEEDIREYEGLHGEVWLIAAHQLYRLQFNEVTSEQIFKQIEKLINLLALKLNIHELNELTTDARDFRHYIDELYYLFATVRKLYRPFTSQRFETLMTRTLRHLSYWRWRGRAHKRLIAYELYKFLESPLYALIAIYFVTLKIEHHNMPTKRS